MRVENKKFPVAPLLLLIFAFSVLAEGVWADIIWAGAIPDLWRIVKCLPLIGIGILLLARKNGFFAAASAIVLHVIKENLIVGHCHPSLIRGPFSAPNADIFIIPCLHLIVNLHAVQNQSYNTRYQFSNTFVFSHRTAKSPRTAKIQCRSRPAKNKENLKTRCFQGFGAPGQSGSEPFSASASVFCTSSKAKVFVLSRLEMNAQTLACANVTVSI
jgi:hypothetical protein